MSERCPRTKGLRNTRKAHVVKPLIRCRIPATAKGSPEQMGGFTLFFMASTALSDHLLRCRDKLAHLAEDRRRTWNIRVFSAKWCLASQPRNLRRHSRSNHHA